MTEPNRSPSGAPSMRQWLLIVAFGVLLYWGLHHFSTLLSLLGGLFSLLSPLLWGFAFAYILNLPMRVIEEKWFAPLNRRARPFWLRCRRVAAMLLTYLLVSLVLALLFWVLIPQLRQSIALLTENIPGYISSLETLLGRITAAFPQLGEVVWQSFESWQNLFTQIGSFLSSMAPRLVELTKTLTAGVLNLFMGLIFSVYMLFNKERYCLIVRRILCAWLPREKARYLLEAAAVVHRAFSSFIAGQVTEAVILGTLCAVGMSILGMPYPLLIGMLIGVTGIIPIFGAYLGTIPSAFLILMVDPPMALWFLVFILVLQQIEGNLIYPRVVGSSIGLGGMWVMLGLLVGSSLFGFVGMLVGVPATAALYVLLRREAHRRLREKNFDPIHPAP